MPYDNEAIVRDAYHKAEGNIVDIPGWIGSFTEDGVFNDISDEESYRGEHLGDVVLSTLRNPFASLTVLGFQVRNLVFWPHASMPHLLGNPA
jgi:hypothetical protein